MLVGIYECSVGFIKLMSMEIYGCWWRFINVERDL